MKTDKFNAIVYSSAPEKDAQTRFTELLKGTPLPDDELLQNLGLFLSSKTFSRLLFFYELYKKIVTTHGIIVEFGTRWGQTTSVLSALRGIFEPFNRHRKILGFDTFTGLKGVSTVDGKLCKSADGHYSVAPAYENYLNEIMSLQESLNPNAHIKKFELIKGDVTVTLPRYLKEHPETTISLAIFDLDIYKPTRAALEVVKPYLFKGSVLVFDELCDEIFPGETVALNEVFGLRNVRIQRMPMTTRLSFVEIE